MEVEEATDATEERDPREEVRVRRPHIHSSFHDARHGFTPGPTTASLVTVLLCTVAPASHCVDVIACVLVVGVGVQICMVWLVF